MKCLTPQDLPRYQLWQHPRWGAHTIEDIKCLEEYALEYTKRIKAVTTYREVQESNEMSIRRENHIDKYGSNM